MTSIAPPPKPTKPANIPEPKSKLNAASLALVSLIVTFFLYVRSCSRQAVPIDDSVIIGFVAATHQALWTVVVEALRSWRRMRRVTHAAMVLVTGGLTIGAAATASGCATTTREAIVRHVYEDDPDAPPPACIYTITVDGRPVGSWHRDECPQEPTP